MRTLALYGGRPVRGDQSWPPWPVFDDEMIDAVQDVLRSGKVNYWTGQACRTFEASYAEMIGSERGVAVMNGTVSLELILRAAGIGEGDEVITTPRTFVGTATAIVAVGATPVFVDVDEDSQNLDPDLVVAAVGDRTRAILPVHLAGWPCEMDALMTISGTHDLLIVEDCAQAHGATFRGRHVGSIGHAGSFSFCQDKILTTGGEGGLVTTNDEALYRAVWSLKDHGKSYEAVYEQTHPPGFRWLVDRFGSNLRMTEMQGAIGCVLINRLDAWVAARRRNAARLIEGLSDLHALRVPIPDADITHAYYKWYAFVRPEALAHDWTRDRIVEAIAAEGVPCFSGSCSEIYLERAFPPSLRPVERLPVAQRLGETSIMLTVHPTLDDAAIDDTIAAVRKVFAHATR